MQRGLILKRGTIVDSTFIEAPSSTKNEKKERDPEAHSAKKGNVWYFGYKAHIGVDKESGLVHTVKVTAAKCNGLAQRRSDADIRKQAQHHPAYTEADILFVAAEQAEKILVYHSIFPHGLFAPVQGHKFQISVN